MAKFNFWNCVQATAISVVHRHAKPPTVPIDKSDVKNCKQLNIYNIMFTLK